MPNFSPISPDDILQQLRISCQFPTLTEAILARKLVVQTAQSLGLQIEPVELQKAADSFRLKNNLLSAKDTLAWLQRHLLSVDDLEALVYHTVLTAKLSNHLFKDNIEPLFAERQVDYTKVALYEVVLSNFDLALELFYALEEQEITFFEVAQQYAPDPEQARRGGYCGWVLRKDLKPELSAAIFAAKPPQTLKPILVGKQVHLIHVVEMVSPVLDEALRQQLLSELFSDWLQQQVAQMDYFQSLDPRLLPSLSLQP